ncbi:MAG TPA: Do family serine endopeptidase, partial [Gemmataceae bacterium]|nr:Do family serine endopeptidase [Gemmataceae bacterium]
VLPAVVSIESRARPKKTATQAPRRKPNIDDPQLPEELRKFLEEFQRQPFDTPEDSPHFGFGSGFIVDPKGVILTNYHVVDGADQVVVHFADGQKLVSKDVHSDRKTDLAIVRVEAKQPLPYLELGDSNAMEIGDRVLAVGAPFGLAGSVTQGIISAKGRNGLNMNLYEDFLQTDAAINPGNSGGPLVNLEGKVIGINAAIKSRSGGFQGVGLAIASNVAKPVVEQLLKNGTVQRGYLGVQIKDVRALDPEVAARLGVQDQQGVIVSQVFDKSPAAKAGLQEGDVVTALAGKPIKDGQELQRTIASLSLRQPVDLSIVRDGKRQTLRVTIEEQPEDFGTTRLTSQPRRSKPEAETVPLDTIGVEVTDMTADTADQLGFKRSAAGALITKVDPNSIAAEAGLRRGTLVVKVDKTQVKSAAELKDALGKASLQKGVLLQVQSPQGGISYVMLKSDSAK